MTTSHDEFSRLFRSIGTGQAALPAAPAAREAEQRWPLLGALPPQKPASVPALSDGEKQQRNSPRRQEATQRKPALTLPGIGDKLAFNLNRMAEPKKPAPAAQPARTEAPAPVAPAVRAMAQPQPPEPAERRSPFSRMRVPAPQANAAAAKPGLFATGGKTASAPADDRSLNSVFARLERREEPAAAPAERRTSFLGRLGRR